MSNKHLSSPLSIVLFAALSMGCDPAQSVDGDASTPEDDAPALLAPGIDAGHTEVVPVAPVTPGTSDGPALTCATPAYSNEDGQAWSLRLDVPLPADGTTTTLVAEAGPVHADTGAELGLQSTTLIHDDATIEFYDQGFDMRFGNTSLWGWAEETAEGQLFSACLMGLDNATTDPAAPPCCEMVMSCWTEDVEPVFTYDAESGTCLDEAGVEGTNPRSVEFVRETGDGECASLAWQDIGEGDHNYPDLDGWNLKGADLSGAELYFGNLVDAELEGARFDDFSFGYAEISGSVDEHTVLPSEGCEVDDENLDCIR